MGGIFVYYFWLGGIVMEDRSGEVFAQYDMGIYNSYRTRGAFVLETNQGLKLFKNFDGSKNRVEFEDKIKEHLYRLDYKNIDRYVRNKENEIITKDTQGSRFVIKNWFNGEECNLRNSKNIILAASNLAKLHKVLIDVDLSEDEIKTNTAHYLPEVFNKHSRELKRVRSYIREKKQKNEFEICYLNGYERLYEKSLRAIEMMNSSNYVGLFEAAIKSKSICHGNYTYHNITLYNQGVAISNFDKSCIGLQIMDLYQFMRKVMEKNNWDIAYGKDIIGEYNKIKNIEKDESEILYVLLLYPEKFWKITNFYFNGKKSWIPQRNIQKLINIQEQSIEKEKFLKWVSQELGII